MPLSNRARVWNTLATSIPALPGGSQTQFPTLVSLLTQVRDGADVDLIQNPGDADRLQKQLGTLKFTRREGECLVLTESGSAWLREASREKLANIFHEKFAFFGEVVDFLVKRVAGAEAIRAYAADEFHVGWTSLDQVRRRLTWLRSFGLIEEGAHRTYFATELGIAWLEDIEVLSHAPNITGEAELVAAPSLLSAAIASCSHERRVLSWDYLPKSPVGAISTLLGMIERPRKKSDVVVAVAKELEISDSSAKMFIDGMSRLDLFEYVGKSEIRVTPLGNEWLTSGSPLNLVRLLHCRFLGLGESLSVIDDEPRTIGEIHRVLYQRAENSPNQSRTASIFRLFTEAGAAARVGPTRYVRTDLGRALADELPMSMLGGSASSETDHSSTEGARTGSVDAVVQELASASRDASNPARFEAACASAFEALDVSAEHLGGPGRTDVLVTIWSNLQIIGRAIVDAKAASGQLNERSVNFEALKEHAHKAKADLIAVVAPTYDGTGRIREWATSNGVVLLTADELGRLIQSHQAHPFSAIDIRDLLTVDGHADAIARQESNMTYLELIASVVGELVQEKDEPVSARDIARLLRRGGQSVTDGDVSVILEFLALPQVAAIEGGPQKGYTLPSSLAVAAKKLRAVAGVLDEASR
ncbi:restriction endonuclease [Microbacterium sp.]|uniref:restriction endonuclease n=1 Tax=Microbacterium sp. TaxID=51671 RepID=UPI001AC51D42|nr:restriction endonuclease [Microbacterium sp.]MBN9158339.1 restriction endonuclease [Microbacterium sp.]